ncbi:cupin domain-containing protein [Marinovum algicola]
MRGFSVPPAASGETAPEAAKDDRMTFPDFITSQPGLDLPYPEDVVQSATVRSNDRLVVFFTFLKDMDLPLHAHKAQWGSVVEGEIELTIGGETRIYRPGDSYSIAAGVEHGARIKAGTRVIDVFEEPDRYPLKP